MCPQIDAGDLGDEFVSDRDEPHGGILQSSVGWVERKRNPSWRSRGDVEDGFRGVYHQAGPPGPAFGRPDGRLRPDPVAQPILHVIKTLVYLEQRRRPHAAADAHGDDGTPDATAPPFDEDVAGHARSAHAKRMADRDRAAVNSETCLGDAEPVAAVEHLAGKRFVELPQIDIVD